jgi:hypothetical protein
MFGWSLAILLVTIGCWVSGNSLAVNIMATAVVWVASGMASNSLIRQRTIRQQTEEEHSDFGVLILVDAIGDSIVRGLLALLYLLGPIYTGYLALWPIYPKAERHCPHDADRAAGQQH